MSRQRNNPKWREKDFHHQSGKPKDERSPHGNASPELLRRMEEEALRPLRIVFSEMKLGNEHPVVREKAKELFSVCLPISSTLPPIFRQKKMDRMAFDKVFDQWVVDFYDQNQKICQNIERIFGPNNEGTAADFLVKFMRHVAINAQTHAK